MVAFVPLLAAAGQNALRFALPAAITGAKWAGGGLARAFGFAVRKAPVTTGLALDGATGFKGVTSLFSRATDAALEKTGLDKLGKMGPAILTFAGSALLGGIVGGQGGAMLGATIATMYEGYKYFNQEQEQAPVLAETAPKLANNGGGAW